MLIARDAERLLVPVLDALAWCDEIVLVDSGSRDQTMVIAAAKGARVIEHAFAGYGAQKAFAVAQASHDWVFVVDTDELVTPELEAEIGRTLAEVAAGRITHAGFEVPISLVFLGRLMRHGTEYGMPHLRLFDRRRGNFNANRVHERVELDGTVGRLQHHLLHDSYGSLERYFEKFNEYTTGAAVDLAARGRTASIATVVLRFPLTFLRQYLINRQMLNGYPGFLWSLFSAMYPVVKYAKLRERQAR